MHRELIFLDGFNPGLAWYNLDIREQHGLFYFVFDQKLQYSIKTGYRTDEIPTTERLFEEFVTENSLDVHPLGIEPRTLGLRGPCSAN